VIPHSLGEFLDRVGSVTVLTGAGVSTASGIPDYRDEKGDWKAATPIQYSFSGRPGRTPLTVRWQGSRRRARSTH
jgi:NAD-dependent SIR2 family protein deacetylase